MILQTKIVSFFSAISVLGLGLAFWPRSKTEPAFASSPIPVTARQLILVPHEGKEALDEQIRQTQALIARLPDNPQRLSQLGRQFIAKARVSFDPGFYKLAELCADELEKQESSRKSGLLLRGHCLLAMHHFEEGERIARQLTNKKEQPGDMEYALLGDALMEQGNLEEAIPAYQAMIDARPCLPTYSRAAHLRWLTGNVEGAAQLMAEAVNCGSQRDAEPLAWVTARLGMYELQRGNQGSALALAHRAAQLLPDYAPALLLQGKIHLFRQQPSEAAAALEKACAQNPLPEYQWALADALRAAGKTAEAAAVKKELLQSGAQRDPRTFSLWLSTHGLQPPLAMKLAQGELASRRDGLTWDAVAWAQFASGDFPQAEASMAKALAPGTADARLYLHAGLIARALGKAEDAQKWLGQAQSLRPLLLPSEVKLLEAPSGLATHLSPVSMATKLGQAEDDNKRPIIFTQD